MLLLRVLVLLPLVAFSERVLPIEMGDKAGYISLTKESAISNASYLHIRYALEEFRKQGVSFVLLDLDTPGG